MIEYKKRSYNNSETSSEDTYYISDKYYINNYIFKDMYYIKNKVIMRRNIINNNIGIFLRYRYK